MQIKTTNAQPEKKQFNKLKKHENRKKTRTQIVKREKKKAGKKHKNADR